MRASHDWIRLDQPAQVRNKNGKLHSGRIVSLQYNWLENRVVYMAMILEQSVAGGKNTIFHYKPDRGQEIISPEQPEVAEQIPAPIIHKDLQLDQHKNAQLDRPVRESPSRKLIELLCALVERPAIMEYLVKQDPELLNQSMIQLYGGYEHERLDGD